MTNFRIFTDDAPPELLALRPDTADGLMVGAYLAFLKWAASEPDVCARFEVDTGMKPPPKAMNGMEAMIDAATGADGAYGVAFIVWATKNMWGEEGDGESAANSLIKLMEPNV